MNYKKILKYLSVVAIFLVLLISLPTLCGCEKIMLSIAYNVLGPHPYTIKNPEKFLEENCGIVLPSEARVDYNCASTYFRGAAYFFACYYPDVPDELNEYVGASLTDEEKSRIIERMNRSLAGVLSDCKKSLDDLDDKIKPHWDSLFITSGEVGIGLKKRVYFPETQYYLIWWNTGN